MQESILDVIRGNVLGEAIELTWDNPAAVGEYIAKKAKQKFKAPPGSSLSVGKVRVVGPVVGVSPKTITINVPVEIVVGGSASEIFNEIGIRIGDKTVGKVGHYDIALYRMIGHMRERLYSKDNKWHKSLKQAVDAAINGLDKDIVERAYNGAASDNLRYNINQKLPKGFKNPWGYEWIKRYKASKYGLTTIFKLNITGISGGYAFSFSFPTAYGNMPVDNEKKYKFNNTDDLWRAISPVLDAVVDRHKNYTQEFSKLEGGKAASPAAAAWPSRDELKSHGIQMLNVGPKRQFRVVTNPLTPEELAVFSDMIQQLGGMIKK